MFEGALPYAGMRVTPSWGGSMFEALMPALFVPEERWAPGSWGANHPLDRARADPPRAGRGRLRLLGLLAGQHAGGRLRGLRRRRHRHRTRTATRRTRTRTLIDHGYPGCPDRDPQPDPPPSAYTNGVVTPHAAFLALRYAPRDALANLRRLERDFPGLYGKWGFRDSVNVDSGAVSDAYLSLDQGMIMAALGNALGDDVLRRAFVTQRDGARACGR